MSERLMAQGKLQELNLLAKQRSLAVDEARRAIREATGPLVATKEIDSERVLFLAGELHLALEADQENEERDEKNLGLRPLLAEIGRIKKEFGL